ncbi:uncharacterized protein LOC129918070 [Episyrphus balteatus]|uniref:uncharacterized protein LOC129918070 n=1 Tax=Episyrphus balteatus TaxID=286459 RepID=UPI002485E49D|nr:uncharacterized protein LOC129918070 [Episyrphus balteatus]XP_055854393.1 uncharacterized protein LOC129918070 [Episyrphus balteatus]
MMRDSPAKFIANPQEEALHLFCKQMLKSRLFKGFYKERCYIDAVNGYRDQIIVNRNEKDLIVILEDIERRLRKYYLTKSPPMWIGITSTQHSSTADTCIWVELDELAFDQYWFSVKSVRLRENEIIIKLKPIRPVEADVGIASTSTSSNENEESPESIGVQDFIQLVMSWGTSTKRTIYEFMSRDISKENLAAVFKFLILVCISLFSLSIEAVRFLGIFTIRFMAEFRKILAVSTPIIMRTIDLCGKIIGGFYILLAMIWRDVKKGGGPPQPLNQHRAITYDRPIYQRIKNEKMSQKSVL